jgi:signal transduction histidine kinase
MEGTRWWTLAIVTAAVVTAALAVPGSPFDAQLVGGLLCLLAFVIAWVTIGIRSQRGHALAFIIALIVISGVGTALNPWVANMQAVAIPLIWTLASSVRRAVTGNIALVVSIAFGLWLGNGMSWVALAQASIIESLSFAFSLALGFWISAISTRSHERQLLVDELREAQSSLEVLNRDAGAASERERLAREIHDTIAQDLTGLVMLTQRARRELRGGSVSAAGEQLELIEESARSALAETRALVASTGPVGLSTGGIEDALNRLAERFSRETSVTVGVEVGALPALERDTEVVLLRVAQEGLANVRKHADAQSAVIELAVREGAVALTVRDDGAGFDERIPTAGFGLGGMRDRLALVGGGLTIASAPGEGTELIATLPLASGT